MLAAFTRNALIITDNNPYTEFPLGRSWSDTTIRTSLDAHWLLTWKKQHFPN
jgi:hypothetical protein